MFALCSIDKFGEVNLKCNPEKSVELREQFSQIRPAFHMNKMHWNSVNAIELQNKFVEELILDSYKLVVSGLTNKEKSEIELGI